MFFVTAPFSDRYARLRREMVQRQLQARDVHDKRVLQIMEQIPRHLFVPPNQRDRAYGDHPLPIGLDQTISQPYMVAYMTEALHVQSHQTALEIGTGCGYQTAILAHLAREVCTMERLAELSDRAHRTLAELNIVNVRFHVGDGHAGWPEPRTFDRILVTAAAESVPPRLIGQLADGGELIIPIAVADEHHRLIRIEKQGQKTTETFLCYCTFVPLIKEE